MSTISMRSMASTPRGDGQSTSGSAGRWMMALLLLGLIAFGIAWLAGFFATDPRVLEIRKLQADMRQKFSATGGPSTLVEATSGVVAMGQIRQKIEALPERLRPQAEKGGEGMFRSVMLAKIKGYFALPPEKRNAELDRQIKQEELMRKAWETGGAVMNAITGASQSGGTPQAGQTASGNSTSGGRPSGGPTSGGSEESRNKWRKDMIDRTSPEQRADYIEYRRAMDQRRTQLGLPSMGPR